ncbi:MAG: amidohydrolase family protein [Acidobacteria bacterium]|nr:amidohydrolase family protein [Acidobacteriota bacterium]
MPIIDTHAHIYSPDETKYPVIEKPLRPPKGKGSLEGLREESRANGVRAVCAIQTSTFYRFDNRYILDSSKANPDWVAGVCTLDPDDPRSPSLLVRNAREYGVRGMRSIAAADKRLDHPGVRALWKTALDEGIVINVLTGPELTDQVDRLLRQFPALPVVLDHCFNPKAGPDLDPTVEKVLWLSRHHNLHAKLTFVGSSCVSSYPCTDLHDACLRIARAYGAERCVWGSDYPNGLWTPKVTYAEHLKIFTEALPFSQTEREAILGGTAQRLWFPNL